MTAIWKTANCRCWYLGPSENGHFVMAISMMLVCLNSKQPDGQWPTADGGPKVDI
jgi:hypothetical protein